MRPFNSARYQTLLRGLNAREQRLSEVQAHPEFRAEAEFYLASDGVIDNFIPGQTAVPFAQYGTSDALNEEEIGFPVLRLNEMSDGFIERPDKYCATLSNAEFEDLKLKAGDVLICRTNGNPRLVGMAALIMEDTPIAFASYLFKVRPDLDQISPATLMVFLNCRRGRMEIEKHSIRSNQVNYSPERLRQSRVPRFSTTFQQWIERQVAEAYNQRRYADATYLETERIILSALSLTDWTPPSELAYTEQAINVFALGRLDAEYFQPKYRAMLEHVRHRAIRCRTIDDIAAHCDRGEQPEYTEDGTLSVVTSQHILETGLDYEGFDKTDDKNWNNPAFTRARIYQNDILTYTTGSYTKPPGRTALYFSSERSLASNHVNVLRLREESPVYVAAVMHSMIGRWQSQSLCTGSIQQELYPQDIRQLIIPFVDEKTEAAIVKTVQDAYNARRRAHALLDAAKRAVETAIEDSEAAALNYLQKINQNEN